MTTVALDLIEMRWGDRKSSMATTPEMTNAIVDIQCLLDAVKTQKDRLDELEGLIEKCYLVRK